MRVGCVDGIVEQTGLLKYARLGYSAAPKSCFTFTECLDSHRTDAVRARLRPPKNEARRIQYSWLDNTKTICIVIAYDNG